MRVIARQATKSFSANTLLAPGKRSTEVFRFNLSGHGHFDMGAYGGYFSGGLEDCEYPEEAIKAALERLPEIG